jgi:hypothetical protein
VDPLGQGHRHCIATRSLRAPWTMSKGLSRPLHPRPRAFVPLDPDRCFDTGFRPKRRCQLSLWKPIDQRLESSWAFALDPRGICGETRRAGRLPCATWPARNEEHPSHIVPPSGCGMSFARVFGSRGFRPAAISRARCSACRHHVLGPSQHFVKRWQRSCFHKPRVWRTCWGKQHREAPRTQRFCKRPAPNSLRSGRHFSLCSGGSLDSVRFAARRRAGPCHPLAQ